MKKTLLAVIAFVGISGLLFSGQIQITNFKDLRNALDEGKVVSVKVKIDHAKKHIKEIGYHIVHFMYDGENIHTSRKIVITKNGNHEILIAFITFKPDGTAIADVTIIDPKTREETSQPPHKGKINNGDSKDTGNVYLYTVE